MGRRARSAAVVTTIASFRHEIEIAPNTFSSAFSAAKISSSLGIVHPPEIAGKKPAP